MAIVLRELSDESNEILDRLQTHLMDQRKVPSLWLPGDSQSRYSFSTPYLSCSCSPGRDQGQTSVSIIFKQDEGDFTGMNLEIVREGSSTWSVREQVNYALSHRFGTHVQGFYRLRLVRPSRHELADVLQRIKQKREDLSKKE